MIDPASLSVNLKMDTKIWGKILQTNLHEKYQPIFGDVGIEFEEADHVHYGYCLIPTFRVTFKFRLKIYDLDQDDGVVVVLLWW